MLKSLLVLLLAGSISVSPAQIDVQTAKVVKTFKDAGTSYTMFECRDGNGYVAEGKYKRGKYTLYFNTMGTDSIYDDEIVYIAKGGLK